MDAWLIENALVIVLGCTHACLLKEAQFDFCRRRMVTASTSSQAARDALQAELGVCDVSVSKMNALSIEGDRLVKTRKFKLAVRQYERAAKMAAFLLGEHPFAASVLGRLANTLEVLGDSKKSNETWQQAQRIYEAVRDDGAQEVRTVASKLPNIKRNTPYTSPIRVLGGNPLKVKRTNKKGRLQHGKRLSLRGAFVQVRARATCWCAPRRYSLSQ